jgi:CRISPR-associated protein Csm5
MSVDVQALTGKKSKIQKGTFTVSPFSPVFVGSGDKLIADLDFISQGGNTYLLDLGKLFADQLHDLEALEKAIKKADLRTYLIEKELPAHNYNKLKIAGKCDANEILSMVTNGFGKPMIPGSSIKGSLRTALFAYYFKQERSMSKGFYSSKIEPQNPNRPDHKHASNKLEEQLLINNKKGKRGNNPNYDLGRVIRISDALFEPEDQKIFNIAILNKDKIGFCWKGKKENFDTLDEATKTGVSGIFFDEETAALSHPFTMSIDEIIRHDIEWEDSIDFKFLARVANEISLDIIHFEKTYYNRVLNDIPDILKILNELDGIEKEIQSYQKNNTKNDKVSWVQRLGWGSGWLSMTGAHANDENELVDEIKNIYRLGRDGMEFPKSRKVVLDNAGKPTSLLGWVLIEQQ